MRLNARTCERIQEGRDRRTAEKSAVLGGVEKSNAGFLHSEKRRRRNRTAHIRVLSRLRFDVPSPLVPREKRWSEISSLQACERYIALFTCAIFFILLH